MKKMIVLLLVLALCICAFSGCSYYSSASGDEDDIEMKSLDEVELMLDHLTAGDEAAALAMMHKSAQEKSAAGITQLCAFFAGKEISAMEMKNISRESTGGTVGTAQRETASFAITLEDGTEFYITVVHLTDEDGAGFLAFQLVLGVI